MAASLRIQLESIATCVVTRRKAQACLGTGLFLTLTRYAISRGYVTAARVTR